MKQSMFIALIAMMWFVVPARAAEQGTTTRQQLQTQREDIKQERAEIKDDRCELSESKITFRLNQMTQTRDRHYETYQNINSRIDGLIARWESRGCDVSKLKTERTQLETMLNEFAAAFRDLEGSMQDTKQYQCGDSQGQFVSAFQAARTKNTALRQKALAIRTYMTNTVRATLTATAKSCVPSPAPSASPVTGGTN